MNNKIIKRLVYCVSSVTVIAGLFVVADYYSVFGTEIEVKLDFAEVRFRTLDADTGGIIMNANVRCIQKHIENACTRKESHQVGVISVNIPVQRVIKKTILFKKKEEIVKTLDPKIHIMLIQQNYHSQIKIMLMEDIYANKVTESIAEMKPRDWGDSEPEDEERE